MLECERRVQVVLAVTAVSLTMSCQSPMIDAGTELDAGTEAMTSTPPPGDSGMPDGGLNTDSGVFGELDGGWDAGERLSLDAGVDAGVDAGIVVTADAVAYCECVFVACHDDFHATFGLDDLASLQACEMFASTLPRADTDVLSGYSLECRVNWCQAQPADCPAALGLSAICSEEP